MKAQLEGQQLRLRIDESEFAALREGERVFNETLLADTLGWNQSVIAVEGAEPSWSADRGGAVLAVPLSDLDGYAARLPSRVGLDYRFALAVGLELAVSLQVDVRDSVRQRMGKSGG